MFRVTKSIWIKEVRYKGAGTKGGCVRSKWEAISVCYWKEKNILNISDFDRLS